MTRGVHRNPDALESTLVRTKGGKVIHRSTCSRIGGACSTAKPWFWAEDRRLDEVAAIVDFYGYKLCKFCQPLEGPW